MLREFQSVFIFAVCLLTFTGGVFFVKYENERAQTKALEAKTRESADKVAEIQKQARLAYERSVQANKRAAESARKAKEARQMFEQAALKRQMSQEQIVSTLNAQLEREADARIAAENSAKELAKERDNLAKSVEETRMALEQLNKSAKPNSAAAGELSRIKALLSQREAEIERLKVRQSQLERLEREARQAQLRTEMQMRQNNYRITIPKSKRLVFPITKFRSN